MRQNCRLPTNKEANKPEKNIHSERVWSRSIAGLPRGMAKRTHRQTSIRKSSCRKKLLYICLCRSLHFISLNACGVRRHGLFVYWNWTNVSSLQSFSVAAQYWEVRKNTPTKIELMKPPKKRRKEEEEEDVAQINSRIDSTFNDGSQRKRRNSLQAAIKFCWQTHLFVLCHNVLLYDETETMTPKKKHRTNEPMSERRKT